MSHRNGLMSSYTRFLSWLLIFCLISTFLARTAAGSCLQYGHSCWGAHGKRSEIAPSAPLADINDITGQDESWEDSAVDAEPAWQKLRRVVTHRSHHVLPPPPPIRQHNNVMSEDQDDEQPPPRWLYQLMRQAAATKMD